MGYDKGDNTYEHFFFPIDKYSEAEAIAQYPYTAYEYDGETFYSIEYRGLADENEI